MKKSFKIFCAAALVVCLALPFLAVSAFAEDDTLIATIRKTTDSAPNARFTIYIGNSSGTAFYSNQSLSTTAQNYTFHLDTVYCWYCPLNDGQEHYAVLRWLDGSTYRVCSMVESNPTVIDPSLISTFSFETIVGAYYSEVKYCYFIFPSPPPDPLAPVSDGVGTVITVFGDVIDYIINTPDVAIFVAISVAGCAIIPLGIVVIKKIIKGY